jgi:hypothetical protein
MLFGFQRKVREAILEVTLGHRENRRGQDAEPDREPDHGPQFDILS